MQMQDVFTQWDSLMKISSFTSREPNYILKLKGQQIFCTNTHFFLFTWFHIEFIRVIEAYNYVIHTSRDVI